ncbi:MAG TPA: hypothetical protein VE485_01450 [Mycobacterium sp.]|jgi:hypothetical protein|nr:hypothetical protein [Mycobacterium sp.]
MTTNRILPDNDSAAEPHRMITSVEEGGIERISAFGADHAEICGAFKPASRSAWSIYVTTSVATRTSSSRLAPMPPHVQVCGRKHARQWVELIARLYIAADHLPPKNAQQAISDSLKGTRQYPVDEGDGRRSGGDAPIASIPSQPRY